MIRKLCYLFFVVCGSLNAMQRSIHMIYLTYETEQVIIKKTGKSVLKRIDFIKHFELNDKKTVIQFMNTFRGTSFEVLKKK